MRCLPHVLIVDESDESREVLRTLLERCGATTIEARSPELAVELADRHRPDLIVFDAESDHSTAGSASENLVAAADRNSAPVVILGTVRHRRGPAGTGQFVAKPYHYGQLIRRIGDLLDAA